MFKKQYHFERVILAGRITPSISRHSGNRSSGWGLVRSAQNHGAYASQRRWRLWNSGITPSAPTVVMSATKLGSKHWVNTSVLLKAARLNAFKALQSAVQRHTPHTCRGNVQIAQRVLYLIWIECVTRIILSWFIPIGIYVLKMTDWAECKTASMWLHGPANFLLKGWCENEHHGPLRERSGLLFLRKWAQIN